MLYISCGCIYLKYLRGSSNLGFLHLLAGTMAGPSEKSSLTGLKVTAGCGTQSQVEVSFVPHATFSLEMSRGHWYLSQQQTSATFLKLSKSIPLVTCIYILLSQLRTSNE